MSRIFGYLRASTNEQDADRARSTIERFVEEAGRKVSAWFVENESGATLKRPELFRILDIAEKEDVLLLEQVDRLSRLNAEDWEKLKSIISSKGIRIVALDLPTSHQFMTEDKDGFTQRILEAVNAMLLDMLAAVARKDYEDRRRRQKEGIERGRKKGRYKGRQRNEKMHQNIIAHLRDEKSYSEIEDLLGCSRSTISAVKKRAVQEGQL